MAIDQKIESVDPYGPARIRDRMMIQDLMYRWCRAVDRLDRQGMLDVFHPDAFDSHGPYIGPAAGLVDWIMKRHEVIPFSSHFIGNLLIEFVTDDQVLVESYVRTIQQYPAHAKSQLAQLTGGASGSNNAAVDMFTSSRYLDRVERRNGEWRIADRTLVQDWKQLVEVKEQALQIQQGWVMGTRDGSDALNLSRRELGLICD